MVLEASHLCVGVYLAGKCQKQDGSISPEHVINFLKSDAHKYFVTKEHCRQSGN